MINFRRKVTALITLENWCHLCHFIVHIHVIDLSACGAPGWQLCVIYKKIQIKNSCAFNQCWSLSAWCAIFTKYGYICVIGIALKNLKHAKFQQVYGERGRKCTPGMSWVWVDASFIINFQPYSLWEACF